jgi:hypothetical protein
LKNFYNRLKELSISDQILSARTFGSLTTANDNQLLSIKMGKYTAEYEVYYKERGNKKHSSRIFMTEAEACDFLK